MIRKVNTRDKLKLDNHFVQQIQNMIHDTKSGILHWQIDCSTTEYNATETKPVEVIEGKSYTVDECYVSYYTKYNDKEFLMITYEMMHQAKDDVKSMNLVFLPPLGNRFFDVSLLLPYAVEADQIVTYHIHMLWETILASYKANEGLVTLNVDPRQLTIEDE